MDKAKMTAAEFQKQGWLLIDMKTTTFGRLLKTIRGYIGLAPAAVQPNDGICVLSGGQALYTLRSLRDGSHEFVGEYYVHGIIDGQALKDQVVSKSDFILV